MRIADITPLIPSFLLADRNGYAIAKAIEKAAIILTDTIQAGVDAVLNVDKMPEWRLDEMAWEYNCLYDYNAGVEVKRHWIGDAMPLYAVLGTPQAVYNFLDGYFDQIELEEYWQYAGKPFHFRITVSGELNDANEAWMRRTIAESKNVRSILDDIAIGSGTVISLHGEGNLLARFPYPMTDEAQPVGLYPQENFTAKTAEGVFVIATHEAHGNRFPYPMTGTKPQENTLGKTTQSVLAAQAAVNGVVFPYPATSEDQPSGTNPGENTLGRIAEAEAATQSDGKATAFSYSPCAEAHLCGEDF